MKDSISKFMAYAHMTVNEISRLYLSNERRYNYTTPKSFLEQIKLYQNLLLKKGRDLTAKMERLENGLEKLKSTSAQVRKPCWLNTAGFPCLAQRRALQDDAVQHVKFVLDLALDWLELDSWRRSSVLYWKEGKRCMCHICYLGGANLK